MIRVYIFHINFDSVKQIDESNLHNSPVIMHTLDGYFSFIYTFIEYLTIKYLNWLVSLCFDVVTNDLDCWLWIIITERQILYKIVFYDGWHGGWHSNLASYIRAQQNRTLKSIKLMIKAKKIQSMQIITHYQFDTIQIQRRWHLKILIWQNYEEPYLNTRRKKNFSFLFIYTFRYVGFFMGREKKNVIKFISNTKFI